MRSQSHLASLALFATLAGCVTAPAEVEDPRGEAYRPGYDLETVEADLLAKAREQHGEALVAEALAASSYLFAIRYYGMLPPPPPEDPNWQPPTPPAIVMMKRNGTWLFAEGESWRQARPAQVAEIERIAATPAFREEAAQVPACPDYGSGNLILKLAGMAKTVRSSGCPSEADRIVSAAGQA